MTDITNPPAFPNESGDDRDNNGMTLRDYFAAKIVQVSLAGDIEGNIKSEIHASWSYKMADAMLKAREADAKLCEEVDKRPGPVTGHYCADKIRSGE